MKRSTIIAFSISAILFFSSIGVGFAQIAVWNPSGLTGYGPSPWAPTTLNANLSAVGLTRGSGIGTGGTAAGNAWGGAMLAAQATSSAAITANQFVTFSLTPNSGFTASFSTLDLYYRRSSSGPQSGLLQYAVNAGSYTDIATLSFSSSSSSGAAITQVSLTSVTDLQNIPSTNTINFRLVVYGNTGTGTFYVYSTGLSIGGSLTPVSGTPSITVAPAALSGFSYVQGSGPSADQSFTVSGSDLTSDISITAPTNYEISLTSGSGYTSPITLTQTSGTVATTTIYARLKAGLAVGTYNGETVACTSTGATTQNVTCNGSVSGLTPTPTITVGTLTAFGNQTVNTTSTEKTYSVSGTDLTANIVITPPVGFEISTTTGTGFISNPATLTLTQTGGIVASTTIFVRFAPTLVQAYTGNITHTSAGATQKDVAVSGTGTPGLLTLPLTENFDYVNTSLLSSNGWTIHSGSGTNSIAVTNPGSITYSGYLASGIGGDVVVKTTGEDVNLGFVAQNSGSLYASFIVNIDSTKAVGDYFFNLAATSGTTVTTFAGRVWAKKDASTNNFAFGVSKSSTAANISYTPFVYVPGVNYLIVVKYTFLSGTGNDIGALFIDPTISAVEPSATIQTLTADNATTDIAQLTSVCIRQGNVSNAPKLKLDGIRVATSWADLFNLSDPSLSITPSTLSSFNYLEGSGPSTSQSYTVSGANLTGGSGNISVTGSANYEVSTDDLNFSGSANIPYSGATLNPVTVHVRLKAGLAAGSYNAETIIHSGGGVSSATLTCNGSVTPIGPSITVGTLATFGNQYQYSTSTEKNYTVSGLNLTGDVTITPPAGFEISLLTGTAFVATNPIILTPTLGTLASTTINVRFVPTLVQAYTGNITHTSPGATTQNVAVSGTGIAPVSVNSIAALRAGLQDGTTVYRLSSEALVTFQRPDNSRNQIYIQDATGGIVIDDLPLKITTDYNIGDGVTGITGTLLNYNNLLEFLPVTDPGTPTTTGNAVVPLAKTIATITTADQAELVSLSKVTFTQTGSFVGSFNYTITDASGSMILRTIFTEADYMLTPIPTTPVNLVGLVGQFAADMQFTPRFSDDFTLYTPSWTSGYPKAENPSPAGFTAKVNLSDPGTAYYVVLPNGASAPSALQVKNGQDASGTAVAANLAGSITCTLASSEYVDAIAGLTAATTYNVYFVAESYSNLQATPVMVPVTTTSGSTTPVLLLPTVTSITSTSAILGGEISTDGGSAITERGTVWSTTSPVTIANNKLAASGTTVGVFSHLRTSLPAATQIYFAAYATNANGTALSSQGNFYTFAVEPSEHVTAFIAGTTTTTTIPLTWSDATTGVTPTAYLIKASSVDFASIVDPVDGTPESDGTFVKNVAQGAQTVTFTGLNLGTTYYFKIYPYTGSSATINYKTTATVPSTSATTLGSSVYIWEGADNASWTDAVSWAPDRTAPLSSDILQFSDGTTKTIIDVPTASIGQFIMSNNTTVNLQAGVTTNTLTITGNVSGDDLIIPAGCALNLNKNVATIIQLAAGATASIAGNMEFSLSAHRLLGTNPSSIIFAAGSVFKTGTSFGGNAFGTTSLNSVIFESGSTLHFTAGSSPFGATQPSSVIVFQTGSLYKHQTTNSPAFSGRTYANIEFAQTGTVNVTGSSAGIMDNLTVTSGILNMNLTGDPGHLIKGNVYVASGATLNFNPASAGTVRLNGSSAQSIVADGTLSSNTFSTLEINNSQNVILGSSFTLNGGLKFTNGHIVLGNYNLTLGATSAISGTPSSSSMIIAEGTGELRKTVTANGTFTFPVGDMTSTPEYSPVTLTFTSVPIGTGYAGVNLVNAPYPGVTGSYLNRYWNVTTSGLVDVTYDAQFNYVPADVVGTESDLYCYRVAPTNDLFAAANTTSQYLTAIGLTSLGSFTGKEQPALTKILNVKFFLEGLYNTGTGFMNEAQGSSGPQFGAGIADQVTIELRESASPNTVAYTFTDANLNTDGTVSINTIPGAISGDYYVVINHRNSIQTWSASAVSFSGSGPIAFDFTTAASQAYGNNMKLMGATYAIYGGDASQDGIVDGSDMALIDNASTSILLGYNAEDINGDGVVDGSDMALIDNNSTDIIQIQRP